MALATVSEFQIGSVIGRGVSVFFRNIIAFAIVTVLLFIVPVLLTAFVFVTLDPAAAVVLTILAWLIAYFWLSAALVYGVVSDLRGNKASVGEILSGALSVLLPVSLISIVVGVIVLLGWIVFIIPGIFLYVIFWVAVPAAVVERTGVIDSMKRSLELTKGNRWKVFFVLVLWIVISFIIQVIVAFAVGVPMMPADQMAAPQISTAGAWIADIVNMLLAGIGASILAVGYHDLRVAKEGIGSDEIARTFD